MEQRLIDANALIKFVDAGHLRNPLEQSWSDRDVVDMIESAPTVDAVPVVRCMKCRHAKQYSADGAVFWCGKNNLIKYGVFYCADGERSKE